jgi:hypothetical protein
MNPGHAEMKGNIAGWLSEHCKISMSEKFDFARENIRDPDYFMIDEKINSICLGLFSASSEKSAKIVQLYSGRSLLYD